MIYGLFVTLLLLGEGKRREEEEYIVALEANGKGKKCEYTCIDT